MKICAHITAAFALSATSLLGQEVVIGALEGPPEVLFGRIADVGTSRAGHLVVVDHQSPIPLVFSADGTFLGELGRSGEGPGEFRRPRAVGVSDAGRVAVVDVGRVSLHQLSEQGPTFLRSFRLDHSINDVCWIGERLFAIDTHGAGGGLIIELGPDGEILNSFGERIAPEGKLSDVYGDEPPSTLNQGRLACDEREEVVGYASGMTGKNPPVLSGGRAPLVGGAAGVDHDPYSANPDGWLL